MKQIAAILIAFFLCVSTTQVSAQRVLPLKIVSTTDTQPLYSVEPTDDCLLITGKNNGCVIILPNPTTCIGRVIRIINRKTVAITIRPHFTGADYPVTAMSIRTSSEWVSDGDRWFLLTKSW